MADITGLMPPIFVDQAERHYVSFCQAHSDSMPIVVDNKRIIRRCDPRLREMLGYGWQSDIENGRTPMDVLLPPQYHSWHAELFMRWFSAPRILDMHSRGPLPIMSRDGQVHSALVKLVPYEPELQGRLPLLDEPVYHRYAAAFVTLLPRSFDRYVNAAYPAGLSDASPGGVAVDTQRAPGGDNSAQRPNRPS